MLAETSMLNLTRNLSTLELLESVYKRALRYRFTLGTCLLCGLPVDMHKQLCRGCTTDLPWANQGCLRCAQPLASGSVCGRCLISPPPYQRTVATFDYRYPMDGLIKQLKYGAKIDLAVLLGALMSTKLQTCVPDAPQCVIPVPLHPKRLMKRGFNQSLELARTVSRASGIRVDPWCVKRALDTPPQASLPASARRNNVRGAFSIRRHLNYTHVAIIDDVITSAWTAHELTKLLISTGVERIDVWVCCRAFPQV